MPVIQNSQRLFTIAKDYVRNFNLFESIPPTTDLHLLRNQKVSTRLFIFLLVTSLTILILYTSLASITKTFIVPQPSYETYQEVYSKYSDTLTCPCQKISISYSKFITLTYSLHPVCKSAFITEAWISFIMYLLNQRPIYFSEFVYRGAYSFKALRGFCELVNETISDGLDRFYSAQYVSGVVAPSDLFESQSEATIDAFISSTTREFQSSLDLIREMTQTNALLSALFSNFFFYAPTGYHYFYPYENFYSDCSCKRTGSCNMLSTMVNRAGTLILYSVPGFYVGCFIVEALLQSTFECFFDSRCFNRLISDIPSTLTFNGTVLDASQLTLSKPNTTIQEIMNQLMVEKWNQSVNFENYYKECGALQCIYTKPARNDLIYIITAVIGLLGGLVTVLKITVPKVVYITYILNQRRAQRQGK